MSMNKQIELQCPACKHKSPFTLWESINVTVDPWAREQMLAGTFFQFTCPHCGQKAPVNYGCLYHDMDRQLLFYLISTDEGDPRQAAISKRVWLAEEFGCQFPSTYQSRVVCSAEALREKVLIDNCHLDDRLVELCKLFLRSRVEADAHVQIDKIVYAPDEAEDSFLFITQDGRAGLFPAGGLVRQIAEAFGSQLPAPASPDFALVDEQWAADFLESLPKPDLN